LNLFNLVFNFGIKLIFEYLATLKT